MSTIRDKLVTNPNYFDEYIEKKIVLNKKSEQRRSDGSVSVENMPNAKHLNFIRHLELFIARYSAGATIEDIKQEYLKLLPLMVEGWDDSVVKFKKGRVPVIYDRYWLNEYCYMIWMLSLAILLRVSKDDFNILKKIILDGNIDDELILFLLGEDTVESSQTTYRLFKYLLKKDIRQTDKNHIKKYLEKWYERTKLYTWHNYNPENERSSYYGRWSFESAVIVALLDLDDTKFRDNQYYPKDLVDYYRAHG